MSKKSGKEMRSLARVAIRLSNEPAVCGIELVAVNGASFIAAVDAAGLAEVMTTLLQQAAEPTFAAATMHGDGGTPQVQAPGTRIELAQGRHTAEVAATLTVGAIQLVCYLPAAEVLRATAEMVRQMDGPSAPPLAH